MSARSTASVNRQMSPSLSATRERSSSGDIAASPVYRSISAASSSFFRAADGSFRVTSILNISVSEREAVAAMVATHRRLDEARAIAFVAAGRDGEARMTGVRPEEVRAHERRTANGCIAAAKLAGDRLANHRSQILVIH